MTRPRNAALQKVKILQRWARIYFAAGGDHSVSQRCLKPISVLRDLLIAFANALRQTCPNDDRLYRGHRSPSTSHGGLVRWPRQRQRSSRRDCARRAGCDGTRGRDDWTEAEAVQGLRRDQQRKFQLDNSNLRGKDRKISGTTMVGTGGSMLRFISDRTELTRSIFLFLLLCDLSFL